MVQQRRRTTCAVGVAISTLTFAASFVVGGCADQGTREGRASSKKTSPCYSRVSLETENANLPGVVDLIDDGRVLVGFGRPGDHPAPYVWQAGARQTLAMPAGMTSVDAFDMNERGQVLGGAMFSSLFIWNDGIPSLISTPGKAAATHVNALGHIVGYYWDAAGVASHAFLERDGEIVDLGGANTSALNDEDVVLVVEDDGGVFRWKSGARTDLPFGTYLDNHGTVAGIDAAGHAGLWADGVVTDLGTLGGATTIPVALADSGDVVGSSSVASGELHPFLFRGGKMIDLTGATGAAQALNEVGQVTGWTTVGGRVVPFVWDSGVTTVLDIPVGTRDVGMHINASGLLAGNVALRPSGPGHPPATWSSVFVWAPEACAGTPPPDAGQNPDAAPPTENPPEEVPE